MVDDRFVHFVATLPGGWLAALLGLFGCLLVAGGSAWLDRAITTTTIFSLGLLGFAWPEPFVLVLTKWSEFLGGHIESLPLYLYFVRYVQTEQNSTIVATVKGGHGEKSTRDTKLY